MPAKPKKTAAFFDVDNTLVSGSTSILFGKVAFTGGSIKRRDIWRFMWEHVMYMRRGEKNSKQEVPNNDCLPPKVKIDRKCPPRNNQPEPKRLIIPKPDL